MFKNFNLVFPFFSKAFPDSGAEKIRGFFFRAGGEMVATQNVKILNPCKGILFEIGGTRKSYPSLNKLPMTVQGLEITLKDIRTGSNPVQPTINRCLSRLTDGISKANNLNLNDQSINLIPGNGIKGATGQLNSYSDLTEGLSKGCSMVEIGSNTERALFLKYSIKYSL